MNWKIHELHKIFTTAGLGHPTEREAAYELARLVPDLMIQNERMKEMLKQNGVAPKFKLGRAA